MLPTVGACRPPAGCAGRVQGWPPALARRGRRCSGAGRGPPCVGPSLRVARGLRFMLHEARRDCGRCSLPRRRNTPAAAPPAPIDAPALASHSQTPVPRQTPPPRSQAAMSFQESNEGVEQAAQPQLCVTGCGFFANYGSGGMCSKCFREAQAQEQKQHAEASPAKAVAQPVEVAAVVEQPPAAPAEPSPAPAPSTAAAASSSPGEAPKTSTRCNQCRKKVGLTGFKCKCGLLFCGQHRYAEAHDCSFDYKTTQRQKLAAANPVVQAAKVERI